MSMPIKETYQDKAKRDLRYKEFVIQYGKDRVRRYSMSNQQLHPQYVTDWDGELVTGFGNTQYQTLFPKLYMVEVR